MRKKSNVIVSRTKQKIKSIIFFAHLKIVTSVLNLVCNANLKLGWENKNTESESRESPLKLICTTSEQLTKALIKICTVLCCAWRTAVFLFASEMSSKFCLVHTFAEQSLDIRFFSFYIHNNNNKKKHTELRMFQAPSVCIYSPLRYRRNGTQTSPSFSKLPIFITFHQWIIYMLNVLLSFSAKNIIDVDFVRCCVSPYRALNVRPMTEIREISRKIQFSLFFSVGKSTSKWHNACNWDSFCHEWHGKSIANVKDLSVKTVNHPTILHILSIHHFAALKFLTLKWNQREQKNI